MFPSMDPLPCLANMRVVAEWVAIALLKFEPRPNPAAVPAATPAGALLALALGLARALLLLALLRFDELQQRIELIPSS